jgi:hypothetical protein
MNFDLMPHLAPFVVAYAVLGLLAVLAVAGATTLAVTPFFRRHRADRLGRHEAFVPYYSRLALHH